jgi:hypothetical protein
MLVESKLKFVHAKHKYNKANKTVDKKPLGFKVHLLEQESIRTLYRNRLKGKLTPLTEEIEIDWLKIKKGYYRSSRRGCRV